MLDDFLNIVKEAKGAGARIFTEWTNNPGKFLGKGDLPIDKLLLSLTEEERKKIVPLLEYFTELSFFYLFKKLEEGEGNFSFNLSMKNDHTGDTISLIDEQTDNDIRTSLQEF